MQLEVLVSVTEKGKSAPKYDIGSDLSGEVTLQELLAFTKQSLIIIADETLYEEQQKGFDKDPVTITDGKVGKPITDVQPFGKIEFVAKANANDILLNVYQGIEDRSPIDTGKYISSNYVFFNSTLVAKDPSELSSWLQKGQEFKQGDRIRFVNVQPYARKLERYAVTRDNQGNSSKKLRTTKSRDKKNRSGTAGRVLAPNGAYYLTYRSMNRIYKFNSKVAFQFLPGSSFGLTGGKFKARNARERSKGTSSYLYPTILITISENGIL